MLCYAILWRYSDNSDFGLVGFYDSETRANATLDLLRRFHDGLRTFTLVSGVVEGA